jgi:hypothetical protein
VLNTPTRGSTAGSTDSSPHVAGSTSGLRPITESESPPPPYHVAQGGDVGAGVTDAIGRLGPEGLIGIHTNLLVPALNDPAALPGDSEQDSRR